MAPRKRVRYIRYGGEQCGVAYPSNTKKFTNVYLGNQTCLDETHPGPPYRTGGPFSVVKRKFSICRFPQLYAFYDSGYGYYNGYLSVPCYTPPSAPTALSLAGWGAKGWNRTQPVHPVYQLGVSIGELKDLPRMVTQTLAGFRALAKYPVFLHGAKTVGEFLTRFSKLPKNTGDAYLYGAFGLAPMIQDLLFLMKMREKLDKKISFLRRHNGKAVRRKVELDAGQFSEDVPRNSARSSSVWPILSSYLYPAGQSDVKPMPILKSYKRRIWYSAKYRYYIPELAKDPRISPPSSDLVRDLLGLSPDPAIIYKLTPWSWLLDWFSSVGSVVSNIYARAKYHVMAEYAYVMCSEHFTYACPGSVTVKSGTYIAGKWSDPDKYFSGVSRTEYEFRQREVANPYGFGLTYASLSSYQWSILAALGLSRGGKHSAPRT